MTIEELLAGYRKYLSYVAKAKHKISSAVESGHWSLADLYLDQAEFWGKQADIQERMIVSMVRQNLTN
jgi:hypothetical protein